MRASWVGVVAGIELIVKYGAGYLEGEESIARHGPIEETSNAISEWWWWCCCDRRPRIQWSVCPCPCEYAPVPETQRVDTQWHTAAQATEKPNHSQIDWDAPGMSKRIPETYGPTRRTDKGEEGPCHGWNAGAVVVIVVPGILESPLGVEASRAGS